MANFITHGQIKPYKHAHRNKKTYLESELSTTSFQGLYAFAYIVARQVCG